MLHLLFHGLDMHLLSISIVFGVVFIAFLLLHAIFILKIVMIVGFLLEQLVEEMVL
jgi:hypothetical protein